MNLPTVFEVFYAAPYPSFPGEERSQLFSSRNEAERMQVFYEACGSKSYIKERTVNTL